MSAEIELVRRFRRLHAVVIGDAILDTYLWGTAERLCTEGPVPIVRKIEERKAPGGAANTAANLVALGARVTFLGVVGRDAPGGALLTMLRELGVDVRWLIEDEAIATQHKLRILADGHYVVRFDEGTSHAPSAQTAQALLDGLEIVAPACDVLVLSDYCYGAVTSPIAQRAQALHQRHGMPLVVDSKQLGRLRSLRATAVTPNLDEARALVAAHSTQPLDAAEPDVRRNVRRSRAREGERLAEALLNVLDTELAAVTLADDGVALAARDGRRWRVSAHPVAHPNDVGAGDSFTSALALALAAHAQPDEAARIGVDAAGIAVSKRYTSQVDHRELLQRVSLRERQGAAGASTWATSPSARRGALRRLRARIDLERAAGRVVVFTNGVFDVLHAGHIEFLRQAKALGDILIVGVNSDLSVERLSGARTSQLGERDRLALLSALEPVDYVALFDDATPERLIRALRPHIHAKGGDYADEALPESAAVRAVGGRVVILPLAGATNPAADQAAPLSHRIVTLTRGATEAKKGETAAEGDHAHAG